METIEQDTGVIATEGIETVRKQVDLVPLSRQLNISGVKVGACGALLPRDPTMEVIHRVIAMSGTLDRAGQWILGDALCALDNRGIDPYSPKIQQLTNRAQQTLVNLAYLCRSVPHEVRRADLTVFHHQVVAALEIEQQIYWLEKAAKDKWSGAELKRQIRIVNEGAPISDTEVDLLPEAKQGREGSAEGALGEEEAQPNKENVRNLAPKTEGKAGHVDIPMEGRYALPWIHLANFSLTNDTGTYEFNFEIVRQATEEGKERFVGYANNRIFFTARDISSIYAKIEEFCYNLIHRSSDVLLQARELTGPLEDTAGGTEEEIERIPEETQESVLTEEMLAGV